MFYKYGYKSRPDEKNTSESTGKTCKRIKLGQNKEGVKEVERGGGWDKGEKIERKNETGWRSTSKVLEIFDEIYNGFYQSVKILFGKEMNNRKTKKICKKTLSWLKEENKYFYGFVSEIWVCW